MRIASARPHAGRFVVGTIGAASVLGCIAGCGGSSAHAQTPSDVQHVTIVGNDSMRFVPDHVVVHPGTVEITLRDVGQEPHNIDFPQLHVKSPLISGGKSTSVTLHVAAGHTYDFDCDIHISEGMVGTLVVSKGAGRSSVKGT
jgi:plastocyanin